MAKSSKSNKVVKIRDIRECPATEVSVTDVLEVVSEDIEERMPDKLLCITFNADEDTYTIYSSGLDNLAIISALEICKTELIITNYLIRNQI